MPIINIDKEKAFDKVGHAYLFTVLKTFAILIQHVFNAPGIKLLLFNTWQKTVFLWH